MEISFGTLPGSKRLKYNEKMKKEKLRRSGSVNNVLFPRARPIYNYEYHYNRRHTIPATTLPTIVVSSAVVNEEHDGGATVDFNNNYDNGFLSPSYALDAAVASNDSHLLQGILSGGNVTLSALNASGGTAMHEAAFQGKVDCLYVFLKFGIGVDIRDKEGWTPLHAAVCGGDLRAAVFLIRHGADLEACTNEGHTPVRIATDAMDRKMVKALTVAAGSSKRQRMLDIEAY